MEYNLIVNQEKKSMDADLSGRKLTITTENKVYHTSIERISNHHLLLIIDGQIVNAFISTENNTKTVIINGQSYEIRDADQTEHIPSRAKSPATTATQVVSPMPAIVTAILTCVGDRVKKGQGLVIVSAMKMETTLFAPYDGRISKINANVGDKVVPADILVDIEKQKETE